jgi:diphthine synthase
MTLFFIGLGLGDDQDISLRGLETVRACEHVFLDGYTSLLRTDLIRLERVYGKKVQVADRELVEERAESILDPAKTDKVAFLVVGDIFGATTHHDLVLRARKSGVECRFIYNASILTAVGVCGLQLYRFGETVSLTFWTPTWRPTSWYDKLAANRKRGLHTLFLLDIRVREPSEESLARGRKVFEPPRYMTVADAAQQLLVLWNERAQRHGVPNQEVDAHHEWPLVYDPDTVCIGIARVGQEDELLATGSLQVLARADFGPPLHSLVMPGEMHAIEKEFLQLLPSAVHLNTIMEPKNQVESPAR